MLLTDLFSHVPGFSGAWRSLRIRTTTLTQLWPCAFTSPWQMMQCSHFGMCLRLSLQWLKHGVVTLLISRFGTFNHLRPRECSDALSVLQPFSSNPGISPGSARDPAAHPVPPRGSHPIGCTAYLSSLSQDPSSLSSSIIFVGGNRGEHGYRRLLSPVLTAANALDNLSRLPSREGRVTLSRGSGPD